MSAGSVRALLARHGLAAHRDLGQNFLVDDRVAAELVELADVGPGDRVIEVGPGLGILTRALAAQAESVWAVEIDAGLVRVLNDEALLPVGATLVHDDALRVDWPARVAEQRATRIVANLPYSVSAPLLRRFLDVRDALHGWSVMLQRDVAQRLLAVPGSRDYGSLSVLHRLCVDIERARELGPGLFYPVPKVRSTFVRMVPHRRSELAVGELAGVERIVRAAFGQRRKTLANALRGGRMSGPGGVCPAELCADQGVDPRARAETLAPEVFLALHRAGLAGVEGPSS